MSYGLYDCDFVLDKTKYFNLELMKYSTYLKRKRNIVSLSTSFNPEQYTNFIYRKDFEYEVDDALPIYKNLTYGGRAFHKATYVPLPIEIESCVPDTSIYEKFSERYYNKERWSKYNSLMTGEHLRLSLDGKTIWKDFEKQLKKDNYHHQIYLYDYNLNDIEGAPETLIELGKFYRAGGCGRVGNKFPIQVYNIEDLTKWKPVEHAYNFFQLQYNGLIPKENNEALFDYLRNEGYYSIFLYNFTYNLTYEDFLKNITDFYRQITEIRTLKRKISLIYDMDFFLDPQWYKVVLLIDRFYTRSHNRHIKYNDFIKETMLDFVETLGNFRQKAIPIIKSEAKELLTFVEKESPELYEAFSTYHF